MSQYDPLLHGPQLKASLPSAQLKASLPSAAEPHAFDLESSTFVDDLIALHFSPWRILDAVKNRIPGSLGMLKIFVGLFGLTWLGALLSWNLDGRATTLGLLERIPDRVWALLQNGLHGIDVQGLVYQLVFIFKQTGLFLAPFWTIMPAITWAALATVGLYIVGKRQNDAFLKLLLIALFSQWFNVWRAVPVTGGVLVTLAQLSFGIYGIKRVFDLPLKTAMVVTYLVPMLVLSALLFSLVAVMAAI